MILIVYWRILMEIKDLLDRFEILFPQKEKITFELKECLMTDKELELVNKGTKIKDPWPF